MKEFASEALSLDSRLLHTLKPLLLKPGQVAQEYVAGHRARFVPPARLYIFASLTMFVMVSLTSDPVVRTTSTSTSDSAAVATIDSVPDADVDSLPTADASDPTETSGTSEGLIARLLSRLGENMGRATEQPDVFTRLFLNRVAQAMFFLVPVFALLLKILYRKRLYVQHLVYSIYFHSFVFIFIAFLSLPELFGLDRVGQVASAGQVWIPVYLFLGMRRVYQESRLRTVLKWAALNVAYLTTVAITLFALVIVSLLLF